MKRLFIFSSGIFSIFYLILPYCGNAEKLASCEHYWDIDGKRHLSGKEVGRDLGGKNTSSRGVYKCSISIEESDFLENKFLFIGQIGDAAYLKLNKINSQELTHPKIVVHGLHPDSRRKKVYYEMFPFFVDLPSIYSEPGIYEFTIHYEDLVPRISGLRSGNPRLLNIYTLMVEAAFGTRALIWHLVQIAFLLGCILIFIFTPTVDSSRRLKLILSAVFSTMGLIQITGLPRIFGDYHIVMRANDILQLVSYICMVIGMSSFLKVSKTHKFKPWVPKCFFAVGFSIVLILCFLPERNDIYKVIYSFGIFYLTSLPALVALRAYRRKALHFIGAPSVPKWVVTILAAEFTIFLYDSVNLVILNSRFAYASQFLGWTLIASLQLYLLSTEKSSERKIRDSLTAVRSNSLNEMAKPKTERALVLSGLVSEIASILAAKRASLAEVKGEMFQFIGVMGNFQIDNTPNFWQDSPSLRSVIKSGKPEIGFKKSFSDPNLETEYLILPIMNNGRIVALLCVTEFESLELGPFFENRLSLLSNEIAVVVALLIEQKRSMAHLSLLETVRHHVHPLQIKSEEYLIKAFEVSSVRRQYSFILGDLAGSVELNEIYGGTKVREFIDNVLDNIFESCKSEGVIVSRGSGDFLTIVFPVLAHESNPEMTRKRAIKVLEKLAQFEEELEKIASSLGIMSQVSFRFVLGTLNERGDRKSQSTIDHFSLIVDSVIDSASRVLSKVAIPGECICIGKIDEKSLKNCYPLLLPPTRLRGSSSTQALYVLIPRDERKVG